jgi:hypothetical protein
MTAILSNDPTSTVRTPTVIEGFFAIVIIATATLVPTALLAGSAWAGKEHDALLDGFCMTSAVFFACAMPSLFRLQFRIMLGLADLQAATAPSAPTVSTVESTASQTAAATTMAHRNFARAKPRSADPHYALRQYRPKEGVLVRENGKISLRFED